MGGPMSRAPRLTPEFFWECPACRRPFPKPDQAAQCPCPGLERPPTLIAPLVRCAELPGLEGHPVALTGWLEAEQAELTVLHRQEEDGALRVTGYRFCAARETLEPTGAFAFVPA